MAREIFIDTSGFFALLVKRDDQHEAAARILHEAGKSGRGFVTTDYVLDETATLLKARQHAHLLSKFFDVVTASGVCRIEWMDSERFAAVSALFVKHIDHAWSFTDCLSFRVMKEHRLRDALTKDAHFAEAGFTVMLAG